MSNGTKNIYLIGFMGSGKSSVAAALNKKKGYSILEMDEEIVRRENMSINDIFKEKGEDYFRRVETELLKEAAEKGGVVVSCGGGVVKKNENIETMKASGKVILLSATPETIYNRIKDDDSRPLLRGHMNVEYISQMMEERRPMYEKASDAVIYVDDMTPDDICDMIEKA